MVCTTVRQGENCVFMKTNGCSYDNGICRETIEKCDGCNRKIEFSSAWYCSAYPNPVSKWKNGDCNLASHVTAKTVASKTKLNPLKASKRKGK